MCATSDTLETLSEMPKPDGKTTKVSGKSDQPGSILNNENINF